MWFFFWFDYERCFECGLLSWATILYRCELCRLVGGKFEHRNCLQIQVEILKRTSNQSIPSKLAQVDFRQWRGRLWSTQDVRPAAQVTMDTALNNKGCAHLYLMRWTTCNSWTQRTYAHIIYLQILLSIIHYPPVSVRSNCRKCIAHVIDLPAARSLVLLLLALNPLTEAVRSQSHVRTINQNRFTHFLESRVISCSVRKLRCTLKTPSCESGHATLAGTSRTVNRGIQAKCFPHRIFPSFWGSQQLRSHGRFCRPRFARTCWWHYFDRNQYISWEPRWCWASLPGHSAQPVNHGKQPRRKVHMTHTSRFSDLRCFLCWCRQEPQFPLRQAFFQMLLNTDQPHACTMHDNTASGTKPGPSLAVLHTLQASGVARFCVCVWCMCIRWSR